jgi:hypothetical protein
MQANPQSLRVTDKDEVQCTMLVKMASSMLSSVLLRLMNLFFLICDSNGNLPLHLACRAGKWNVVSYIMEKPNMGHPSKMVEMENCPFSCLW